MNFRTFASLFLILCLYLPVKAQDLHCNSEILKQTSQDIEKLDAEQIDRFLLIFSPDCENNVEFSEWSNEVLYNVLTRYPKMTIQIMEHGKVDNQQILQEIASPINDGFDLKGILNKVKMIDSSSDIKAKVIEKLNEAIKNGGQ